MTATTIAEYFKDQGMDVLLMMDSTAFVVNVKNNRVVTVVNEESLKGTVFTNIDGTVMV